MELLNDTQGNINGKVILTIEDVRLLKEGLMYIPACMSPEETRTQKSLYDKLHILEKKLS